MTSVVKTGMAGSGAVLMSTTTTLPHPWWSIEVDIGDGEGGDIFLCETGVLEEIGR